MTLPIHIDHRGIERKLSLLPPTDNCRRLRAASRPLSAITPLLPQSAWTPCDYVKGTPIQLRLDQGQLGRCVAGSCTGANALTRCNRTGQVLVGSMSWLYSQICGGSDNGAPIASSQTVMLSTGIPTVAVAPDAPQHFNPQSMPAGAVILKEDEAIGIDTPQDAATALVSLGGYPQVGINVTNSFEHFTPGGIAWNGKLPPSGSNHSIYLAGIAMVDGQLCFKAVNDWDQTWGPSSDGTFYIPVQSIDTGGWLHLSTADSNDDPQAPN